MLQNGDIYVVIMIIIILVIWLWYRFRRWLYAPPNIRLPLPYQAPAPAKGVVAELLQSAGYEWLAGKQRIPLHFHVDEQQLDSRLFVDGIARRGHELYIVKVAKERQPMQWTGSEIRDRLLPYYFIFKEVTGVVYVDVAASKVRKIEIGLDLEELS